MRNLPFVVEPRRKPEVVRIGTEDTGIFEIERRGYLTVTEKASFQQVSTNKEGAQALRTLAKNISEGQKMPLDKANELLMKVLQSAKLTAKEEKVMDQYTLELLEVLEVFRRESIHTQMIMATVLLVSRVDKDWSFDDTVQLDMSMIEALSELYQAEDAKSLSKLSFMEASSQKDDAQEQVEPGKQDSPEVVSP